LETRFLEPLESRTPISKARGFPPGHENRGFEAAKAIPKELFLNGDEIIETIQDQLPAPQDTLKEIASPGSMQEQIGVGVKALVDPGLIGLIQPAQFSYLLTPLIRKFVQPGVPEIPKSPGQTSLKALFLGHGLEVGRVVYFLYQGGDADPFAQFGQRFEADLGEGFGGQHPGEVKEGEKTDIDMIISAQNQETPQVEA